MKTANEIIEQGLTQNELLQTSLRSNCLSKDDVGVILFDKVTGTSTRPIENKPIQIIYSITNNDIEGLAFNFDETKKENEMRKARLKRAERAS